MEKKRNKKIKEKNLKTALILLILFCVSITPLILAEEASAASVSYEYQVFELINEERGKFNLAPLKIDKELSNAATIRCSEIKTSFSHIRPNGAQWYSVSSKANSENLARGSTTPQDVVSGWMASNSHRPNILNPNFKSTGIAYLSGNPTCWVQLFSIDEASDTISSPPNTNGGGTTPNTSGSGTTPNTSGGGTTPNTSGGGTTSNTGGGTTNSTSGGGTSTNLKNSTPSSVKPATPSFSLVSGSKRIAIKWKKVSKANGYEIYRSTSKNGKYSRIKTVTKRDTVQYIDKNLKKKKKYFYRIRSYTVNNGKKVFSNASPKKSKTTK
ncbi:MAG: CAP domain-containing protein [Methanobrevibacter sp.]|nr:CAP domain-containing protein [Methanobrevibacter sp.]